MSAKALLSSIIIVVVLGFIVILNQDNINSLVYGPNNAVESVNPSTAPNMGTTGAE